MFKGISKQANWKYALGGGAIGGIGAPLAAKYIFDVDDPVALAGIGTLGAGIGAGGGHMLGEAIKAEDPSARSEADRKAMAEAEEKAKMDPSWTRMITNAGVAVPEGILGWRLLRGAWRDIVSGHPDVPGDKSVKQRLYDFRADESQMFADQAEAVRARDEAARGLANAQKGEKAMAFKDLMKATGGKKQILADAQTASDKASDAKSMAEFQSKVLKGLPDGPFKDGLIKAVERDTRLSEAFNNKSSGLQGKINELEQLKVAAQEESKARKSNPGGVRSLEEVAARNLASKQAAVAHAKSIVKNPAFGLTTKLIKGGTKGSVGALTVFHALYNFYNAIAEFKGLPTVAPTGVGADPGSWVDPRK